LNQEPQIIGHNTKTAPLISFIIPVFNGQDTIVPAMESIFALQLENGAAEIIVVDDASSDGTVKVVEDYISTHQGVVLLKQKENRRQGACRNRGLEAARGQYVAYLDADDIILPGICKALELAVNNDLQMCGYVMEIPDKKSRISLLNMPRIDGPYISGIKMIAMGQEGYRFLMPTCFIHNREFLIQCAHPFVEGHRAEDSDFALYHLVRSIRVNTVQDHGYHYSFNESSTIHTFSVEMLSDYMLHAERVRTIIDEFRGDYPDLPSIYRDYMGEIVFLRFGVWYLSHLSILEILEYYSRFDYKSRHRLCSCDFVKYTRFQRMVLGHKFLTLVVMSIIIPTKRITRRLRGSN